MNKIHLYNHKAINTISIPQGRSRKLRFLLRLMKHLNKLAYAKIMVGLSNAMHSYYVDNLPIDFVLKCLDDSLPTQYVITRFFEFINVYVNLSNFYITIVYNVLSRPEIISLISDRNMTIVDENALIELLKEEVEKKIIA